MQFIKNNFIGLVAIVLLIILFFTGSGRGCNPKNDKIDTIRVETRTIYVPQPPVYIPQYTPIYTESKPPIIIPPSYQPSSNYDSLAKQYNELVKQYLSVNTYNDTIKLKDSTGKQVGTVNIKDAVSENKIVSREPNYQLNFPHTTTTITIKENYRKLYAGVGLTGTYPEVVNGATGGLLYKTKQDRIYGVDIGAMKAGDKLVPYGGLKIYWPLGK